MGLVLVPAFTPPVLGKHGQRGLAARPKDGRPEEGERLTPDAPHNSERSPPPGATSRHPHGAQQPAWHTRQWGSTGSPHSHTRAHSTRAADPDHPPQGQAGGRG